MSQRVKQFLATLRSPVGRKVLTGLTGLALMGFVIAHMVGNLFYLPFFEENEFNLYAEELSNLGGGALLYVFEIGLIAFFLLHIVIGINIYLRKRRARKTGYTVYKSAGKPSRQSLSSRTMIFSGIVLLVFLVIHINSFKFGPGIAENYVVEVAEGKKIRDLKRLMTEKFQNPLYAFGYPLVILLLGLHLRHGFWSALQSLGTMKPQLSSIIYLIGTILVAIIVIGFISVPLYIFFSH